MKTVSANDVNQRKVVWSYVFFKALGFTGLALTLVLMGCSQGLNWRDISVGDSGVFVWLPCKAITATRQIPLSEDPRVGEITINMVGCEKDGVQFAVSYIEAGSLPTLSIDKNNSDQELKSVKENELDQRVQRRESSHQVRSNIETGSGSRTGAGIVAGSRIGTENEKSTKSAQDQILARWLKLWQQASLKSMGVVGGVDPGPWTGAKSALNPAAQSVTVKSDAGLEAQYIWFGYGGSLYQMAWYKPSSLKPDKALIDTYVNSLQIK